MTEQADTVCPAGRAQIEHAGIVAEKELRFSQQGDDVLKGHLDERDQIARAAEFLADGIGHHLFRVATEQETTSPVTLQQRVREGRKIACSPLLVGFAAADPEDKPWAGKCRKTGTNGGPDGGLRSDQGNRSVKIDCQTTQQTISALHGM